MFTPKVPLAAKPVIISGTQALELWVDGRKVLVKTPILPYFYADKLPDGALKTAMTEKKIVKPLSTRKPETWTKCTFKTTKALEFAREYFGSSDYVGERPRLAHITTSLLDRVVEERPDFLKLYPHTKELKVLVFDLEQDTQPDVPYDPNAPIISVAWSQNLEELQQVYSEGLNDEKLVRFFVNMVRQYDPDVIVSFNGTRYDIPLMSRRAKKYGYDDTFWCRNGKEPFFYKKKIGPHFVEVVSLGGRVHFDVWHAALGDQTLNGVGKGLKSVARHFQKELKIPEVLEEDTSNMRALIGTPELALYNKSDVFATRALFQMYFRNIVRLSELVGNPIARIVPLATSYPFTRMVGTMFRDLGFISDGNNGSRYHDYKPELEEEKEKTKMFEGAEVIIFKKGLFKNIYEYDVGSMYPNIIIALGMGPDNTFIEGIEPYTTDPPWCEFAGNSKVIHMPDLERKWTWRVRIDGYSKIAERVADLLKTRLEMKRASKSDDDEMYVLAYSLKVVLNSLYGFTGSLFNEFGELGVAVLTTGIGRQILLGALDFTGEGKLTSDTDGYKCTSALNLEQLNKHCNSYLETTFRALPRIDFEEKKFESIWILARKNYLLWNKGKMTIHGATFKSSQYPPLYKTVIRKIGETLLRGDDPLPLARKALVLGQYGRKDFIMKRKLKRMPADYKNPNSLSPMLAKIAKEKLGIEPAVNNEYEYVKTTYGYDVVTPKSMASLDKDYYRGVIETALENLGMTDVLQPTLDTWFT